MEQWIAERVESYWAEKMVILGREMETVTRQVEDIILLDEHYSSAQKEKNNLQSALGGFSGGAVDLKGLSDVLKKGYETRGLQKGQLERLKKVARDLAKIKTGFEKAPPAPYFFKLGKDTSQVHDLFESHQAGMGQIFRSLRTARLEVRARYEPAIHDPLFADFNWRHLDNEEMALCPPFVVFSETEGDFGAYLGKLLALATSGQPMKIVVLQSHLDNGTTETGRAAGLKSTTNLELLFLALRNVFFLQNPWLQNPKLKKNFQRALASPRPAVISLYAGGGEDDHRAREALQTRSFPQFVYDPEKATDFVSCLELEGNPNMGGPWAEGTLEYLSQEGEPAKYERPVTFADFALNEPHLQNQFSPLSADDRDPIDLTEYLELGHQTRKGKTPFIFRVNRDKRLERMKPSQSLIAQSADKMHLWHTLQELAGIKNPFVEAAENAATGKLTLQNEKALKELKGQMEAEAKARESQAVAKAMKNLAMKLTGEAALTSTPGSSAPKGEQVVTPSEKTETPPAIPSATQKSSAPVQASETAWIEEKLCTSCDECTTLNKKIFAYDKNKKAYIKDPKGGPFRDIVKSAEKCASGAIHPGNPADLNEKDLEKWIQRAEPFQ